MASKIKHLHLLSQADLMAEKHRCLVNIDKYENSKRKDLRLRYIKKLRFILSDEIRRSEVNKYEIWAFHPCRRFFEVQN